MKHITQISITVLLLLVLTTSCKDDDSVSCTFCSSDQTPEFELCRESDGNASVNGENTGTDYDVYLSDLEADGVMCGGQ
ncbi:hypothetical protein [Candidatus Ulvibacter alkanivorans]|uniref:hypothetical protein n=1 Tax=Candidatus Ulvibacter alkanivorans TaxID=2267620 RepID=UPI000DF27FA5|nr:hypothetical protein [Candidatus Ulvibacter alkanivorans]